MGEVCLRTTLPVLDPWLWSHRTASPALSVLSVMAVSLASGNAASVGVFPARNAIAERA
jgi:hypothetical protein